MIDKKLAREVLAELIQSPEFKDSKRYQELLAYLVDETLEGKAPKEITIAVQFFGKDSKFDPKEDPIVRVSLNNLRKKIEHYYLTTATPYSYRLEIPKGHYQVEFTPGPAREQKAAAAQWQKILNIVLGLLVVLLSAGLLFTVFTPAPAKKSSLENPIWKDFVKPGGRPTLIVLGDFFFLFERAPGGRMGNFVRDLRVNSLDDYHQMIRRDPQFAEKYVQGDFTFLRPSASWGLAEILPFLEGSPNGYSMKLASEFTIEDMKANNVVFIGSFKSLFKLQKVLQLFDIDYRFPPAAFRILGSEKDSTRTFMPNEIKGGKYEKDYAVVAKGVGPGGNTVILMLGFADTGVIEATRVVCDGKMLSRIQNEYVKGPFPDPFYFTLVMESEGISQAVFNANIRHFVQKSSFRNMDEKKWKDTTSGKE